MLDRIRNNPRATELLADVFDFDITRTDHVEPVRLASGGELRAVAGDATGGTFFVCDGGPVLYASSEGSAGVLAPTLTDAVQLIVGIPVWHDVVGLAPDLAAMRAAFDSSFAEMKEDFEPEIDTHRTEITAELDLASPSVDELLTQLSASLSLSHPLLNDTGDEYETL
jgi:hypothetical protein